MDTMIFRYAAEVKVSYAAKTVMGYVKSPNYPEEKSKFIIHESRIKARRKTDAALESEMGYIKLIADHASKKTLELVYSHEVDLELLFQPLVDYYPGRLYGAPLSRMQSPLQKPYQLNDVEGPLSNIQQPYSVMNDWEFRHVLSLPHLEDVLRRFLLLLPEGGFLYQLDFRHLLAELRESETIPNAASLLMPLLEGISAPRYREICRKLNVQKCPNSHMDAYHIWTAETENCDCFLTTESKLLALDGRGKLRIVSPTELVALLGTAVTTDQT
ncbi:hypothetical protein F8A86_00550 [Betaproteobacteria bacterium SCN1]|nr:hypothetical protein F8A86_00550 [Betaproteobacteria bacterium SCN1]